MKVAQTANDLMLRFSTAANEAKIGVRRCSCLISKNICEPRHIGEIQVRRRRRRRHPLGDAIGPCQLRHQKVWEEGPSPRSMRPPRAKIGATGAKAMQEINSSVSARGLPLRRRGILYSRDEPRIQSSTPSPRLSPVFDLVLEQIRSPRRRSAVSAGQVVVNGPRHRMPRPTPKIPVTFRPRPANPAIPLRRCGLGVRSIRLSIRATSSPLLLLAVVNLIVHGQEPPEVLMR